MRSCIPRGRTPESFTARLVGIDGKRATVETVNTPSLPDGVSSKHRGGGARKGGMEQCGKVEKQAAQAESFGAVYDQPAAAGCLAEAGLQCAADDGRGAAAV